MNECCAAADSPNRVLIPDHELARPDLEVRVCRVCGRRHFTALADAGGFGLQGAPLGGDQHADPRS